MGVNWNFPRSEIRSELTHEFGYSTLPYRDNLNVLGVGHSVSVGLNPDRNLIQLPEFSKYNRTFNFDSIIRNTYLGDRRYCCRNQKSHYYSNANGQKRILMISNIIFL